MSSGQPPLLKRLVGASTRLMSHREKASFRLSEERISP